MEIIFFVIIFSPITDTELLKVMKKWNISLRIMVT